MKKRNLLFCALVYLLGTLNTNAEFLNANLVISAKMDGTQQVPLVTTNALGIASFMLNATRDTLCVNISVTGLSGSMTGIHVHEGETGENGNIIIDLSPYIVGDRVVATLSGADVSQENLSKLLSGKFYINTHTAAYPNGEIRGQLYLETDWSFPVILDGSQEVPAISTTAYGIGIFNLSKDLSKINFNIITQDLSGPITGAHLHYGDKGIDGSVAVDLTTYIDGNSISGTIISPALSFIDSLMHSKIYVNVHTAVNPGGEIRSQLINEARYFYFDAELSGNQQVPPVSTTAKGVATIKLNTRMDTLWYDIVVDGLSGAISSAHFHQADVANNGNIAIDISGDISGNRINGYVSGSVLSNELINQFLRGEIYLNVHTALYPNGEIRGQVYRLIREGFMFSMDGAQEIPDVTTAASGSGIVSIDRNKDNASFMFVASGLTATSLHFHNGIIGQEGDVIFDLSAYFVDNGAFDFWKSSDATSPFTIENAVQFINDSVYINIHTSANPDGEIRGQVWSGFQCYNTTTGILNFEVIEVNKLDLYPNPAIDIITLNFNSYSNQTATLLIYDVIGNEIINQKEGIQEGPNNKIIDLRNFPKGIYFIKVDLGNEQLMQKFSK